MIKTNRIFSILLAAVGFTAGCDAPASDAAGRVAELLAGEAPVQAREEIVVVGQDEEPVAICDLVPDDALGLDGLPAACDDSPREYTIRVPGAPASAVDDEFAASVEPAAGWCEEWAWIEYRFFESPCNSCSYKPNMPGWKRAVEERACDACGWCSNWMVKTIQCNPC